MFQADLQGSRMPNLKSLCMWGLIPLLASLDRGYYLTEMGVAEDFMLMTMGGCPVASPIPPVSAQARGYFCIQS